MRRTYLYFFLLALISFAQLNAQTDSTYHSPRLIQLTGVVVGGENLEPVPFANVILVDKYYGVSTDINGFFSIVAREQDSVVFSSIGYKPAGFVIPDTLSGNQYSLMQIMEEDTVLVPEVIVTPWKTYEQFKHAFIAMDLPENDYDRARRNLERIKMKEVINKYGMDGRMNYKHLMNEYRESIYTAGQMPRNNLFSPLAWSEFIKAWKNGDLKFGK